MPGLMAGVAAGMPGNCVEAISGP